MQKTNARVDKEAANDTALSLLLRAVEIDDNDHLAFYYLALQYMHLGMLNEAMVSILYFLLILLACIIPLLDKGLSP